MILRKFIIKDQKELYRHKNYLLSLDLEFDNLKKEYSNRSDIDFDIEAELTLFLKNNGFNFEIIEENIVDFKKQILVKYLSLQIDNNNIFIVEKKENNKIYLLNQNKNKIQIVDLKNSILKSYKIAKGSLENSSLALKTLEVLASNQDDFKELFTIFAILQNQNSEDLLFLDKLKKFKYFCIAKIKEKQEDMFLCNCVTGFFPETRFYIKGTRIFSDYTNFFLNFEQEFRVWKYLYNNKNLVGIEKEATLNELFIGRKIYTLDEYETKVKRVIKFARYLPNKNIEITLTNGVVNQKIGKSFTKEELLNRVIEARD